MRVQRSIAIALISVILLVAPTTFAEAAAPSIDMVVPTGTYNVQCVGGQTAGVVCRTDNKDVSHYSQDRT